MVGPRPDIPYDGVPNVTPSTAIPNDYLGVQANPGDFGGQVGQATEKLGATIGAQADPVIDLAIKYQNMKNTLYANDSIGQFAKFNSDQEFLLHSKKGQDAVDYLKTFQGNLEGKLNEMSESMPNLPTKLAFSTDARNYMNTTLRSAGNYVGDELDRATTASFKGKINTYQSQLVTGANDPAAVTAGLNGVISAATALASNQGIRDPDAVNSIITEATSKGLYDAAQKIMDSHDGTLKGKITALKNAQSFVSQYEGKTSSSGALYLDGQASERITSDISSRQWQVNAEQEAAQRRADEAALRNEAHMRVAITKSLTVAKDYMDSGYSYDVSKLPSDSQLKSAFKDNEEGYQAFSEETNYLRSRSLASTSITTATTDQLNDMLDKARPNPADVENFHKEATSFRALSDAVVARQKQLTSDPTGYIVNSQPDYKTHLETAMRDPSQWGQWQTLIKGEQTALGVPTNQQTVLPTAIAQTMAKTISGDPVAAVKTLQDLKKQFGSYYPDVLSTVTRIGKLSPDMQSVANLATADPKLSPNGEKDADTLARVIDANKLGKPQADGTLKTPLTDSIGSVKAKQISDQIKYKTPELTSYVNSMKLTGASPDEVSSTVNSVINLAYGNMYFNGVTDQNVAIKSAVDAFTKDVEYIGGKAAVPADKFSTVNENVRQTINNLDLNQIRLPPSIQHNTTTGFGTNGRDYLDDLKTTYTPYTSSTADAIRFKDRGGDTVYLKNGKPLEVPFSLPLISGAAQQRLITGASEIPQKGGFGSLSNR